MRKEIFKTRARSNSESGRGTLSSPEECSGISGAIEHYQHQNSLGSAYSGLNTPIVIDRKASLNSPMIAGHVRHILNSLDVKMNQMNGSAGRLGGGRNSLDTDSIAEESSTVDRKRETSADDEDDGCSTKSGGSSAEGGNRRNDCGWHQRRVHSIGEAVESTLPEPKYAATNPEQSGVPGLLKKRRASLQPQRCIDEDNANIVTTKRTFTLPESEYINPQANQHVSNVKTEDMILNISKISLQGRGPGDSLTMTGPCTPSGFSQEIVRHTRREADVIVTHQIGGHYFPPTTIQVEPPNSSNYNLPSSTGSACADTTRGISFIPSLDGSNKSVLDLYDTSESEKDASKQYSTLCKAPLGSWIDDDNYNLDYSHKNTATKEPCSTSTKERDLLYLATV